MRSNKGITLTSLIIYVIVLTIVIATVANIRGYFMKNTDEVVISTDTSEQYTRLTTYLTEDINSINFVSAELEGSNCINIMFIDGSYHKYLYNKNKIYYISEKDDNIDKTITLCSKVDSCSFEHDTENNKLKISVKIKEITYNNIYSI